MSDVPQITQNFARPSYRPEAPTGGLDPDMRRMAIVAAGVGGLLALGIGVFSLSHHAHHGIPVILAQTGPVRVKPVDPGGMKVAGAEEASTGAERLAPEPEKPALHALHARVHVAPKPVETAAAAIPAAAPAAAPALHAAAPLAITAPPPIVAAPVQHAAAMAALPAADLPRGTAVQLAAFETQSAAEQDWTRLSEKNGALFDGRKPEIERATVAGRVVYRLRIPGFANIAAAAGFCGKVRAKGGDCSIAAF